MVIMKKRVVFMGTPEFAIPSLEALIGSCWHIVAVFTKPDSVAGRGNKVVFPPIKKMAALHGLTVFQPEKLKDAATIDQMTSFASDIVVVAAYGNIIPQEILDLPRFGCVNVHPSLLPRYRGPSPVETAILEGESVTGVTIMLLDAGLDSGPILCQREVSVSDDDTAGFLTDKLAHIGAQLLKEVLPLWLQGKIKSQPQDKSQASYTRIITKRDGEIDWHLPVVELWRQVRAFDPWPGCYTQWKGKRLKISQVIPLSVEKADQVAKVIALPYSAPAAVGVGAGDGVLGLLRVQLEGKREMSVDEFILGHSDFIGSELF